MSASERRFLRAVMVMLRVEPDTALVPVAVGEVRSELQKLPGTVRDKTMRLAIAAAAVDGRVEIAERAIVDAMACCLGLDDRDVDHLLIAALLGRARR